MRRTVNAEDTGSSPVSGAIWMRGLVAKATGCLPVNRGFESHRVRMDKSILIEKIKERQSLRAKGKYVEADEIRKELLDLGFKLNDKKDYTDIIVPYQFHEEMGNYIKV